MQYPLVSWSDWLVCNPAKINQNTHLTKPELCYLVECSSCSSYWHACSARHAIPFVSVWLARLCAQKSNVKTCVLDVDVSDRFARPQKSNVKSLRHFNLPKKNKFLQYMHVKFSAFRYPTTPKVFCHCKLRRDLLATPAFHTGTAACRPSVNWPLTSPTILKTCEISPGSDSSRKSRSMSFHEHVSWINTALNARNTP